jgi:hypothetical protein
MGNIYSLKTSLKDQLDNMSNSDERKTLMHEVDVARLTAQRAIHLYEVSLDSESEQGDCEETARVLVKDSLRLVSGLMTDQAKLEATISPFDADTFIQRLLVVINRHLKEHPDIYDKIHREVNSIDLSRSTAPIQIIID